LTPISSNFFSSAAAMVDLPEPLNPVTQSVAPVFLAFNSF